MSDNRKYYYLKLKENFFDTEEIKILEQMTNGYKYSNILLKLYLKSLKFNGALRVNEYIPYNEEMIAAVTNHDVDTVRTAITLFKQLKLIDILNNGTIYMLDIQNFIGKSSTEADRVRDFRRKIEEEKKRLEGTSTNVVQMYNESTPEIELDTELDIELDKDTKKDTKINSKYVSFFNNNFHLISPFEKDILQSYEKDGIQASAIVLALEKAVSKNKRNIEYVKGILNNWLKNNIKTMADVQAVEEEWKRKKKGATSSGKDKNGVVRKNNETSKKFKYNFNRPYKGPDYSEEEIDF
ncbi:DnaD domain protein [Clostridium botulinum D/C]|uniref:phage replisome organizer N-terminal domain-containing protein n=1 Tax=Clostridium botulinum TaxID=1491 RepID=UPI001E2E04EC|nr:phage replisome organizer N-terminal domain-containing protein [Clostridium botulinum]MCD3234283.1 DnaD domain protein [Clostridium botulinum D/C]MCD3240267.1 DnaD domain protein [Clostridium botulinum D/C]MCD3267702.1 DnaD domain protein [Clostridium botulinum D/C]MCD3306099.1 DnaD domain protein [Clostridium botulinum D/C]MCD3314883.1 DnaD domain protein [Clostridium botulinum D/C]